MSRLMVQVDWLRLHQMFDNLIDQKLPAQILKTLVSKGNLPHALLFSGIDGVGQYEAAITVAMALNCESEQKPCGICKPCKKIKSATHPDIIEEKPDGKWIKIGKIRELIQLLSRKPNEAKNRVIIIHDAELINPEGGNALLKVLEEPPSNTFFILITAQRGSMLKTIVSRCQTIIFHPVHPETIVSRLTENMDIPEKEAVTIAHIADGNIALALKMASQAARGQSILTGMRENIIEGMADTNEGPIGRLLTIAHTLFKNKERVSELLTIMKTCFRDLIVIQYAPEKIINRDLAETLARVSRTQTIRGLLKHIDAVHMAERAIQTNANLRLTLEVMMIRMSRV